MKNFFQTKTILNSIFFLAFVVLFFSCKKDMNSNNTTGNIETTAVLPDLQTKVNSSVSGFVTDKNDAAVAGAQVKAGTASTITDRYGYFEIKNVQVVKEAATVTVSYPGYFKGIKTYMATEGKAAFFRIKLLQKTIAGTIDANAGGNVSLANGINISFPSNTIKDENGNLYNGTVNVAAPYIDPTSIELDKIMPGDLRGINTDGYMKLLTSFGMMAVELTGSNGEILQVADGKKSTIAMPVPVSISSEAPTSIPLWHFDENSGLWKEEGSAIKTGNTYVGDVSHFSYWNCDLPNAIIPLSFTIVDINNRPVSYADILILPHNTNSWGHLHGYTDSLGYASVFVTPNTQYELTVPGCQFHSSQTFQVANSALNLGSVTIGGPADIATITGTVTDCNNNPVTNGNIILMAQNQYSRYSLDNTGTYYFSTLLCMDSTNFVIVSENADASQQSPATTVLIVAGYQTVPNIQACGISTETFFNFDINGRTYIVNHENYCVAALTSLGDSSYTTFTLDGIETQNNIPILNSFSNTQFRIWSYGPPQQDSTSHFIGAVAPFIAGINTVSTSIYPLSYFSNNTYHREIVAHITEYGNIGEFIAGSFSGRFYGDSLGQPVLANPWDVSCNFRIKRYQ